MHACIYMNVHKKKFVHLWRSFHDVLKKTSQWRIIYDNSIPICICHMHTVPLLVWKNNTLIISHMHTKYRVQIRLSTFHHMSYKLSWSVFTFKQENRRDNMHATERGVFSMDVEAELAPQASRKPARPFRSTVFYHRPRCIWSYPAANGGS